VSEELFELEMLGGKVERQYRQMRTEVEAMPWGTLGPAAQQMPVERVEAARQAWTGAAFQEYRTGAACAATLRSLIEARAPLDLVAVATRFALDEMVHVELCARMATELGGGTPRVYEPDKMLSSLGADDEPLMRASHQVVAYFCVGEALSIPLLHGTCKAARHPLPRAVLRRIVLDEADHGTFGWTFLDWVLPHLGEQDIAALGRTAAAAIEGVRANWAALRARPHAEEDPTDLGWMQTGAYLALAERSLSRCVLEPLQARGINPL
jgi:hypothetical protein